MIRTEVQCFLGSLQGQLVVALPYRLPGDLQMSPKANFNVRLSQTSKVLFVAAQRFQEGTRTRKIATDCLVLRLANLSFDAGARPEDNSLYFQGSRILGIELQ